MLVQEKDARRVAAAIEAKFGFTPPLVYCAALIAYTDALAAQIGELEQRLAATQPTPEDEEALFAHV